MVNVAGDELECLLLLKKCESGGTGRRARLRGVWIHRTGSSPVSRTKDCFERNSPFFLSKRIFFRKSEKSVTFFNFLRYEKVKDVFAYLHKRTQKGNT